MRKYLQIFKSNWQIVLEYRLNFFLGRVQNIITLCTLYFLWASVFKNQNDIFGYHQEHIFTYIILSYFARNLILNTRVKFVGSEIKSGYLSSVLLKPISYFWQSLTEDMARRAIGVISSLLEIGIFLLIVRPPFLLQTDIQFVTFAIIAVIMAIIIHFIISFTAAILAFWTEEHFGPSWLVEICILMFSGALFPIDVLPTLISNALKLLPFYYLIFFPINVYLGRIDLIQVVSGLCIMLGWIGILWLVYRMMWKKGLRLYQAYGG